jgi:hypothetical protein
MPVFGLSPVEAMGRNWSVVEATERYRNEFGPLLSEVREWYFVSEDGFGNPVGVRRDGSVVVVNHNNLQVTAIAGDFEEFLVDKCLGSRA